MQLDTSSAFLSRVCRSTHSASSLALFSSSSLCFFSSSSRILVSSASRCLPGLQFRLFLCKLGVLFCTGVIPISLLPLPLHHHLRVFLVFGVGARQSPASWRHVGGWQIAKFSVEQVCQISLFRNKQASTKTRRA